MANTLNPKQLGIALGVLFSLCMFVMTLIAVLFGYGIEILNLIATVYIGYSVSYVGSIIGLVYGFIDGLIGGYLLAWLYNWAGKKFK